ncbi:beta strand repeat-containing protein [Sphingomonas sp. CJ20]
MLTPSGNGADLAAVDGAALAEGLGVDPATVKAMSLDELKALLTPEMLAQLGLGDDFLDKLDSDLKAAIRDLEAAFRKKIVVSAQGASKVDGDGHGDQGDGASHDDGGSAHGGVSPLLILGGVAIVGGGIALAVSGGSDATVLPINNAPSAVNDTFSVAEDTPVTFDVRANDTDPDGNALTVTAINGTAITTTSPVAVTGGSVSLGADGRLTFTPAANYTGSPSFTYTVSDGHGGTANGTVSGTVTPVNDAPVAVSDTFTTAEDTPVTINVRANDTDADGDTLTVTAVNGTAINANTPVAVTGGVVTLVGGNLVFTPTANYNGAPSFTYTVSDGHNGTSTATVSGTVTAVNDAPVNATPGAVTGGSGLPIAVGGLAISDPDGATGTFTTTLTVANGTLAIGAVSGGATIVGSGTGTVTITGTLAQVNASLGATTYTSGTGFTGNTTLTMTTSDGALTDTDTLTLSVTAVQAGIVQDGYISGAQVFYDANGNGQFDQGEPVATTDAEGRYSMVLPAGATGSVIALGGTNVDTGLANLVPLKAPLGTTVVNPLTTLVATLMESGVSADAANASVLASLGLPAGVDLGSFDFLAAGTDPALSLAIQKAAVQIAQVITDAVEAGVSASAVFNAITDSIDSGASIDLTSAAALGALLVSAGADASTAASVATATASVNQAIAAATDPSQISDVQGEFNQPGANLPPVTGVDAITVAEDGAPVSINLLTNDVDPEGSRLSLTKIAGVDVQVGSVVAVTGGTVTVGANGVITFTPAADFNGTPSFEYTVADEAGREQLGTVNVTVTPVNDAPAGTDLDGTTPVFGSVILSPLATATDIDGDVLTITLIDGKAIAVGETVVLDNGGTVTLNSDGTLTFSDATAGTSQFTYTVSDGQGGSFTATITVTPTTESAQLELTPAQLALFTDHVASFPTVQSIVVVGDGASIDVAQASALLTAGVTLLGAPVTLALDAGTELLTLSQLQDLDIDAVTGSGDLVLQAGDTLDAIALRSLPSFGGGRAVTLEIAGGTLGVSTVLSAIGAGVVDAGITQLSVPAGENLSLSMSAAGALSDAQLGITDASDVTLVVNANEAVALAADPALITGLGIGVDHLDVVDDSVTITEAQAGALAGIGVDFVADDNVTVVADGTHLDTSLKGLQDLGVDSVAVGVGVGVLSLDLGGSLDQIKIGSGVSFTAAQSDAALDVTVNVAAGTLGGGFDASGIATSLASIGVDHIGVVDNGALTMDYAQLTEISSAGLTFADGAQITVGVTDAQVSALAADPNLGATHIDTLDVLDNNVTITEAQAQALVNGQVAFAGDDTVTVVADGTHLDTNLKGLQDLGVDSIAVGAGVTALSVDLGGALDKVSVGSLVHFNTVQTDAALDVTVHVDAGTLAAGFDATGIATSLADIGVDHIGVVGDGALTLNYAQAHAITEAGLTFDAKADITVHAAASQVGDLAGVGVDHIDVNGSGATINDATAAALAAGGTDFIESDTITVTAQGTEMTTTLKGLQDLHVDKIAVEAGVSVLHVDAGDLSTVMPGDLPQFDVVQSDASLDVTLRVSVDNLSDLDRLGTALRDAGIDHFGLDADPASYTSEQQAAMTAITNATGITFVQDATAQSVAFSSFLTNADQASDTTDAHGSAAPVEILDGAAASLFESGMLNAFTADNLVVDATDSGQYLATTLRDIADFGIDHVNVESGDGPVYVQFGALQGEGLSEIQALFNHLTQEAPSSIFSGNDHVALVVDAQVADALSHIEGAFDQLASIGFTEVDVLGGDTHAFSTDAIEVKVIGEDDDLYHQLAHDR